MEDNAYALMRTADGTVAMLHSSATQWRHRFSLEITLQKGTLILSGILSGSKSYGKETLTISKNVGDDRGNPHDEVKNYNYDPSWEDEIAEFAMAITNNIKITNEEYKTAKLVYNPQPTQNNNREQIIVRQSMVKASCDFHANRPTSDIQTVLADAQLLINFINK